tara:strand:+ start:47 stop:1138 length:1092 start_codon:yes stop_codon:yes gene_type:complete
MESIEQTWNGTVGSGNRVTSTVSRNGDLVHRMYLQQNIASGLQLGINYGNGIVDDVELEIGGQRIDKHTGHWMETWAELTELNPTGKAGPAVNSGTTEIGPGSSTKYQFMTRSGGVPAAAGSYSGADVIYVPLQFWFCRNPGLALPLIALQYHEVKVVLTIASTILPTSGADLKLFADYIYLDTDERRRFAQVSHEYLIEQVQEQSYTTGSGKKDDIVLNFNHPVKELIFSAGTTAAGVGNGDHEDADGSIGGGTWGLKLNGHERFTPRDMKYFTRAQIWQHHSGYGSILAGDGIGVYSFALKPEEHQPSGTCNFSRIDNAVVTNTEDRKGPGSSYADGGVCYAVNYNVLRIMSGMGGLAYSN